MSERVIGPERLVRLSVAAALWGLCALPLSAQDARTSSGGGGLGRPSDRRPEDVARDVAEGYVSEEEARSRYGAAGGAVR